MDKLTILIVEDEVIVAENICNNLKNMGYAVPAFAVSGEEAIRLTAELRPDLILMDIHLGGGMDGITAAEQIHANYDVPIIYLTAFSDTATLQRARISAPFGYVLKPFQMADLRGPIEIALYKHELERKTRDSEKKFRSLFENMSSGFALHEMIFDEAGQPVDYRFMEINPAFEKLTGLAAATILGKTVKEVLPSIEQYWIDTYGKVVTTGEPVAYQNYSQILNRHYDVWAFSPGKGQFAVTFNDITERKRTEEKLAQQVNRLNALHKVERAVISSLDLNTILALLVQEITEYLHVDAAAVLLLNPLTQTLGFAAKQGFCTDALRFTSLKLGVGLAGRAAQDGQVVYITNFSEMDDNPALSQAIADENFVSYFGVPLVAEGQLLGVLELFHRSELAPDPDWLTFLETLADQAAIAMENANLLESTKQSFKETSALYRINQGLIAAIDPEGLMEDVVNLLQTNFGYYYVQIFVADPKTGDFVVRAGSGELGKQIKNQGYRLAAGDGIVGLTADTGKPFFTNDVEELISFIRPPFLTETKSELAVPIIVGNQFLGLLDIHQSAPAYLTERDVQLVWAVAAQLAVALQKAGLYADLQEALHQEQATRAQLIHNEKLTVAGRLLASVSHELNNPIQAIQNALFLLKEEQGLSAQGRQDLEIVLSETERMASMLQRLRTSYQPVSFGDFKPVQVNDVIQDVCALVATHLRHSHITFEFHADPDLPSVPGVEDQLRQVILNLFMNAVDAMEEGGHLTIATQFLPYSHEMLMTVSDTGPGIDENILPNIFEAFVTNKERGTGLGLTISYEIILKHRGRIQAKNNAERGATICVWLPADIKGKEMSITGKILIIDDEPALRQTLARILQQAGMEVTTAENGEQGLAFLDTSKFDLIYMDLCMPGLAGLDALDLVRSRYPGLPVILFTAQPDLNSAVEALRRGATDYLLKPLKPETFIERTKTILLGQQKERRRREILAQIESLQVELKSLDVEESAFSAPARAQPASERYIKRGALTLDLHARRLSVGEQVISLPPTSFDILFVLARHAPNVVDYQTLVTEAQGIKVDAREAQELIKWHIHHIRQAIEQDAHNPNYLFNVRGIGYRLIAD